MRRRESFIEGLRGGKMSVKKVLHIAGNMDAGGAETLIMNINRNIDTDKLRFDYAVENNADGFYAQEIKQLKGNLYPFITLRPGFATYWFNVFNLIKIIKRNGPYEALHIHYMFRNWFFLAVAYFCGIKKRVSHSHNVKMLSGGEFFLLNLIRRRLLLLFATDLFACSEQAGIDLYGKNAKFTIMNNGIDCSRFAYNPALRAKTRAFLGIENKFVLGNIGRLSEQKNHTFLLDIFKNVSAKNKNAVLMIAGTGHLETELKQKAEELGLKDIVMFLGARKDTAELYQAMDVFVFPSLFEGLGIVAIEAQTAGLPCVMADTIPPEAFVVNCASLPLESGAEAWAREILNYTSFDRRDKSEEIKSAGFDIKTVASQMQEFYLR